LNSENAKNGIACTEMKRTNLVAETMSTTMVMTYSHSDAGGGGEEDDDGSRWL
jgi:hypothetical protein